MLIVGKREMENGTVNVRTRDNKVHGEHKIEHILSRLQYFKKWRMLNAEKEF